MSDRDVISPRDLDTLAAMAKHEPKVVSRLKANPSRATELRSDADGLRRIAANCCDMLPMTATSLHLTADRIEAQAALVREMADVLRRVEWICIGPTTLCPACWEEIGDHASDCRLAAAMAKAGR